MPKTTKDNHPYELLLTIKTFYDKVNTNFIKNSDVLKRLRLVKSTIDKKS